MLLLLELGVLELALRVSMFSLLVGDVQVLLYFLIQIFILILVLASIVLVAEFGGKCVLSFKRISDRLFLIQFLLSRHILLLLLVVFDAVVFVHRVLY